MKTKKKAAKTNTAPKENEANPLSDMPTFKKGENMGENRFKTNASKTRQNDKSSKKLMSHRKK
jgi:hypothetical protein